MPVVFVGGHAMPALADAAEFNIENHADVFETPRKTLHRSAILYIISGLLLLASFWAVTYVGAILAVTAVAVGGVQYIHTRSLSDLQNNHTCCQAASVFSVLWGFDIFVIVMSMIGIVGSIVSAADEDDEPVPRWFSVIAAVSCLLLIIVGSISGSVSRRIHLTLHPMLRPDISHHDAGTMRTVGGAPVHPHTAAPGLALVVNPGAGGGNNNDYPATEELSPRSPSQQQGGGGKPGDGGSEGYSYAAYGDNSGYYRKDDGEDFQSPAGYYEVEQTGTPPRPILQSEYIKQHQPQGAGVGAGSESEPTSTAASPAQQPPAETTSATTPTSKTQFPDGGTEGGAGSSPAFAPASPTSATSPSVGEPSDTVYYPTTAASVPEDSNMTPTPKAEVDNSGAADGARSSPPQDVPPSSSPADTDADGAARSLAPEMATTDAILCSSDSDHDP